MIIISEYWILNIIHNVIKKKKMFNNNIKEFENLSVEKKDNFGCAGIRAQVFRLPVEQISNSTN